MFTKGLSRQTQKNLELLKKVPFVSHYYLAGGTGLSLYYGHRYSFDLDFFSQTPEKPIVIASQLKNLGRLEIVQNDENTFIGFFNEVKISFFLYPYPLIQPIYTFNTIRIASVTDIACMKIDALSSRGTKRDFIDLYTICQSDFSLPTIMQFFEKKYKEVHYNMLHILKSLTYFEDAEKDETPRMLRTIDWKEVKKFFEREVPLFILRSIKK